MNALTMKINHQISQRLVAKVKALDNLCSECQVKPKRIGELCGDCWNDLEGNNP